MSREYLHSLRAKGGFRRPDLLKAALEEAGQAVYRCNEEVVQSIGSGANDIRSQARWAARLAARLEGRPVEAAVQATWEGDTYRTTQEA